MWCYYKSMVETEYSQHNNSAIGYYIIRILVCAHITNNQHISKLNHIPNTFGVKLLKILFYTDVRQYHKVYPGYLEVQSNFAACQRSA